MEVDFIKGLEFLVAEEEDEKKQMKETTGVADLKGRRWKVLERR